LYAAEITARPGEFVSKAPDRFEVSLSDGLHKLLVQGWTLFKENLEQSSDDAGFAGDLDALEVIEYHSINDFFLVHWDLKSSSAGFFLFSKPPCKCWFLPVWRATILSLAQPFLR
jgi:hypothetical protein